MAKTSERGLGAPHQRLRRQLLPYAYGRPCPMCGELMVKGQLLDLDHKIPRVLGGAGGPVRMVHAVCNRRGGARIANRMRAERRKVVRSRW